MTCATSSAVEKLRQTLIVRAPRRKSGPALPADRRRPPLPDRPPGGGFLGAPPACPDRALAGHLPVIYKENASRMRRQPTALRAAFGTPIGLKAASFRLARPGAARERRGEGRRLRARDGAPSLANSGASAPRLSGRARWRSTGPCGSPLYAARLRFPTAARCRARLPTARAAERPVPGDSWQRKTLGMDGKRLASMIRPGDVRRLMPAARGVYTLAPSGLRRLGW